MIAQSLSFDIGPYLHAVLIGLIVALFGYLQNRKLQSTVNEIKTDVNSTATELAIIAKEREEKVLALTKQVAELQGKADGNQS